MFKGLRTKIESEQKVDGAGKQMVGSAQQKQPPGQPSSNVSNIGSLQRPLVDLKLAKSSSAGLVTDLERPNSKQNPIESEASHSDAGGGEVPSKAIDQSRGQSSFVANQFLDRVPSGSINNTNAGSTDGLLETISDLRGEISRLHERLRTVIKERDDSNEQSSQLYQLIEKLRRNLDEEKEVNSKLQVKFDESQLALRNDPMNSLHSNRHKTNSSISIKSFDDCQINSDPTEADSVEVLKKKLNDLGSQLADKNRQLKIKQQNLSDMKKALQKEISDHGKTQDRLSKLEDQLKQLQQDQLSQSNGAEFQNGFAGSSDNDNTTRHGHTNDDKQTKNTTIASGAYINLNDELMSSLQPASGLTTPQMDKISYLSRSSASVEDFDSNDLAPGSCNVGVNHEYLRNVLFRYMTSTDVETARHLVKALSVLMNFTPEQSAAVKSAMNSKSSWLRLTR